MLACRLSGSNLLHANGCCENDDCRGNCMIGRLESASVLSQVHCHSMLAAASARIDAQFEQ